MTQKWIPIDQCVHGHVYRIHARNFCIGAYNETTKGFVGIREKFGIERLDTEYHWDTGSPFGTACPAEDLGALPIGVVPVERHKEGGQHTVNTELWEALKQHDSTQT